jgi:hypothetical protein
MTLARNYSHFTIQDKDYELWSQHDLPDIIHISYKSRGYVCRYKKIYSKQEIVDKLDRVTPVLCGLKVDLKEKPMIIEAINKLFSNESDNDKVIIDKSLVKVAG